jgi:hypothetical protein
MAFQHLALPPENAANSLPGCVDTTGNAPVNDDSPIGTTGRLACPDHENEGRCYKLYDGCDATDGNPIGKTFMNFILGGS